MVEAVVSYFKENSKAAEIWVGDNPSLGMQVGRAKPAFRVPGMQEAAKRGGADKVIYLDQFDLVEVDIPGAKVFKKASIFKPVLDSDVIINLPAIRCAASDDLGVIDLKKITVVGEPADSVRKIFKRPNDNPVGMYKGLTVYAQQTCPGCYVNVGGALDNFARSGISMAEFLRKRGEVVVAAGGLPDFDPQFAKEKNLFVCGDCWQYFPTADNIRKAAKLAKTVTYYPGCAPVYIFAQLNTDLQKLSKTGSHRTASTFMKSVLSIPSWTSPASYFAWNT